MLGNILDRTMMEHERFGYLVAQIFINMKEEMLINIMDMERAQYLTSPPFKRVLEDANSPTSLASHALRVHMDDNPGK